MSQDMETLFGTDGAKEKEGVVIQYGDKLRVRIARAGGGNALFAKIVEEERRPYARLIANELLPNEQAQQIVYRSFARGVVLEWSGMFYKGEEVPFTEENCIKMFTELPEFFQFVLQESQRVSNFRQSSKEADSKN